MAALTGSFYLAMLLIAVAIGLGALLFYLLNKSKRNKFDAAKKKAATKAKKKVAKKK